MNKELAEAMICVGTSLEVQLNDHVRYCWITQALSYLIRSAGVKSANKVFDSLDAATQQADQ